MSNTSYPPVDITAQWGRLNDTIIELVNYVPDDKLDWSPRENLWNFKGILLHILMTRDGWLGGFVKDGEEAPNLFENTRSKADIQRELRRSWDRLSRFLSDPARLTASYRWGTEGSSEEELQIFDKEESGHWVAFHLLEHDIHHRSDIFHYLALLDIEHPEIGTP